MFPAQYQQKLTTIDKISCQISCPCDHDVATSSQTILFSFNEWSECTKLLNSEVDSEPLHDLFHDHVISNRIHSTLDHAVKKTV